VVVVEGNYLLLPDGAWPLARQSLDFVWFLRVDLGVACRRLASRHSAAWGWTWWHSYRRVCGTDHRNMLLVQHSCAGADGVIEL
jgi:hypothetical protein